MVVLILRVIISNFIHVHVLIGYVEKIHFKTASVSIYKFVHEETVY